MMTSVPAGQRLWHCPDCGREVLLSITKLDPMACDACLAKLKAGSGASRASTVMATASALPVGVIRLLAVGSVMLLIGLAVGFVVGRVSAPSPSATRPSPPEDAVSTKSRQSEESPAETAVEAPDESTRPGPGYKWVRGYTRKDGVKVKGHWAKDPNFMDPEKKRKS